MDRTDNNSPPAPRVSAFRAGWRWLVRLNRWIDNCWLGDLLGAASLFIMFYAGMIMVGVLQ